MPTPVPPAGRDPERAGVGADLGGIGVVLLMVVCCAGPALLTAGVLAAIDAWLSNPWVIAAAVLLAAAATTVVRGRRSAREACCPPTTPADRDQVPVPADRESRYRR
jgi:mercuric ion transport protein